MQESEKKQNIWTQSHRFSLLINMSNSIHAELTSPFILFIDYMNFWNAYKLQLLRRLHIVLNEFVQVQRLYQRNVGERKRVDWDEWFLLCELPSNISNAHVQTRWSLCATSYDNISIWRSQRNRAWNHSGNHMELTRKSARPEICS